MNINKALFVRLEAKPGKEEEVAALLNGGLELVNKEPKTTSWYAVRFGQTSFGIFDTFESETGREAHLSGKVAETLLAQAPDLLAETPAIEKPDVLAAKLAQ